LWGYSARTHTPTIRISQSVTDNTSACAATSNLTLKSGHPLGFMAVDTVRGKWYSANPLCQGYNPGFTSVYDLATKTASSAIAVSVLPSACNGIYQCASTVGWDTGMEFVSAYGKTITCCNLGSSFHLAVKEFDGTIYTDVSALQVGDDGVTCENGSMHCPPPYTNGAGLFTDGTYLYLFGGCLGQSPGNDDGCPGKSNDLYRYTPSAYKWKKLVPTGGVKPPAVNTVFPMIAYDSKRSRAILYMGGDPWQYSIATNTWSQFTASGTGPVFDTWQQLNSSGNRAGYDPVSDTYVVMGVRGDTSPWIFELRFSGS
jgi:hypothetical protein